LGKRIAAAGDNGRATLEALRDRLAVALDAASSPFVVAALSPQLVTVIDA
jgi:hypothetical protein